MAEATEAGDWRSKCCTVFDRWSEARKRNLFTDVDFLVGEGETAKSFSVHRNVLAFSSPVFEAMFFGDLAEKKTPIKIVDIEPEAFDILVRHVYGEDISFTSIAFASKTYIAADKYLVADLQVAADDYIYSANMDDPQFWEVINQDRFFHISAVRKKCLDYIHINAASLFKSYLLSSVSLDVVEAILQMDEINISEFELLSAVVLWGMGNVQSEIKLKSKLEYLLRYIRFSNLTVDEFCKFDDCHPGLIDADDSLLILKHLNKRTVYKLPQWCSTSSRQRYA